MSIIYNPDTFMGEFRINPEALSKLIMATVFLAHIIYLYIYDAFARNEIQSGVVWTAGFAFYLVISLGNISLESKVNSGKMREILSLKCGEYYCTKCKKYVEEKQYYCPDCLKELKIRAPLIDHVEVLPGKVIKATRSWYYVRVFFPSLLYILGFSYILYVVLTPVYVGMDAFGQINFIVSGIFALIVYVLGLYWILVTLAAFSRFVEFYEDFVVLKARFRTYYILWSQIVSVHFLHRFEDRPDEPDEIMISGYGHKLAWPMDTFDELDIQIQSTLIAHLEKHDKEYKIIYDPGTRRSSGPRLSRTGPGRF